MHPLFNYINNYATNLITEDDFKIIESYFVPKKIKKRQCLLEQGAICKQFAFIIKGAMRKYHTDQKGVEHIVNLYIENWWAGDRESFSFSTPSAYSVDAWEDCEVLLVTRESVAKLTSDFPAFNEMLLKLDERNNISTHRRITSAISGTAEQRYDDFVDCHPYFVNRFPQHIIASYLGISKDTLSRVRKKGLQK
jgi:CRP-like cAMP-binding protein